MHTLHTQATCRMRQPRLHKCTSEPPLTPTSQSRCHCLPLCECCHCILYFRTHLKPAGTGGMRGRANAALGNCEMQQPGGTSQGSATRFSSNKPQEMEAGQITHEQDDSNINTLSGTMQMQSPCKITPVSVTNVYQRFFTVKTPTRRCLETPHSMQLES